MKKSKIERISKGIKTIDMEIALSEHFQFIRNLVVPNVSWGVDIHECDLLVLTNANYAYEVEIKVSKSDLKKDQDKKHGHNSDKIKRLYFAVPEFLLPIDEYIPERAGIICVYKINTSFICEEIRAPKNTKSSKWSDEQRYKLARLGSLRIWNLKKKIVRLNNKQ